MPTLRFAAFGHDDNRLGGQEIGPVLLSTRDGGLCRAPVVGDDEGLSIDAASLALPAGEGFVLNVRWAMPEFGYLWLQADNGGQLYAVPHSGAAQVWNLNYELARTRVLWNAQLEQTADRSATMPRDVRQGLAEAATLLHDAMFANHDRRSRLADSALARAMDAGERLAVCLAEGCIRQQAGATPALETPALRLAGPAPAGEVADGESALWRAAFDEATVTFTEGDLAAGDSPDAEQCVAFAESVGARVRGRALLPYLDDAGRLRVAESDDERAEWRRRSVALARRYAGRIGTWELVPPAPGAMLAANHVRQIAETADAIKTACPEAEIVLSTGELFAHRMAFAARPAGVSRELAGPPLAAVRKCIAQTSAIGAVAVPLSWPASDLAQLMRTVDLATAARRPIHLLLAAAPSRWQDDPAAALSRGRADFTRSLGYWREPWSPEVQARYAEGLVLLARAHPSVVALEWSDFADRRPHQFPYGGLLDATGEPKPIHERLSALRAAGFMLDKPWGKSL